MFISVLLLISIASTCLGQIVSGNSFILSEVKEHFEFKSIPIDGSVYGFCVKLQEKGFELLYRSDDRRGAILSGVFTNKPVTVLVLATPTTKRVWEVVVQYEEKENWYDLKAAYKDLKNQLSQKYGIPESHEYFSEPFEKGDGKEMVALWADKCTYESFFTYKPLSETIGIVKLTIEKSGVKGRISLSYVDSSNEALLIKETEVQNIQ